MEFLQHKKVSKYSDLLATYFSIKNININTKDLGKSVQRLLISSSKI